MTHQGRCSERRHVGVATVVRRPTHVDDQYVDPGRTQPVDSISGKGVPMYIAPDHEYRFVGLKERHPRLPRGNQVCAELVEAPFYRRRPELVKGLRAQIGERTPRYVARGDIGSSLE